MCFVSIQKKRPSRFSIDVDGGRRWNLTTPIRAYPAIFHNHYNNIHLHQAAILICRNEAYTFHQLYSECAFFIYIVLIRFFILKIINIFMDSLVKKYYIVKILRGSHSHFPWFYSRIWEGSYLFGEQKI